MAFASNKRAYGVCDITGFRYRLKDMKKTWDGLLVGPDQWSPKHPQLMKKPTPIDENDGEISNMRTATIAAMIKAGVDPSEHFVEPKSDVKMVGACSYSALP